jgi:hypothetical protein
MKHLVLVCVALGLVAGVAGTARAQEKPPVMKMSAVAQTPEWQKIKSLAGNWEGVLEVDGKKGPITVEMRVTGDGSAVMHVMAKDTPHEMVTMFHPDGDRLLATHYCAAHNQPRMALVKAQAPNQIAFEFVDGTNIKPGDTYMKRLVLTIIDADHHDETWTSVSDGRETPSMTFSYSRKK